jgi:hypothetical protein
MLRPDNDAALNAIAQDLAGLEGDEQYRHFMKGLPPLEDPELSITRQASPPRTPPQATPTHNGTPLLALLLSAREFPHLGNAGAVPVS